MTATKINRRLFLTGAVGGVAVQLCLPRFDFLLNDSGTAHADGTPLPRKFVVWFWGNGTHIESFAPTVGAAWGTSYQTEPLADPAIKPYVSIVTGNTNVIQGVKSDAHETGPVAVLTGEHFQPIAPNENGFLMKTVKTSTIDQRVADRIGANTPFRFLGVQVCNDLARGGNTFWEYLSFRGPQQHMEPDTTPEALYKRLFVQGTADKSFNAAKVSVLDGVRDKLASLRKSSKLSAADRIRLEQHEQSVRETELRLSFSGQCTDPGNPGAFPGQGTQEPIVAKNLAMSRLIAIALQCDLTHVAAVQFSGPLSNPYFHEGGVAHLGVQLRHHIDVTHSLNHYNAYSAKATRFVMSQLAVFLKELRARPYGTVNVLDQSSVLGCTEIAKGYAHTYDDWAVIIAGKAGGRLRGNVHHRWSTPTNISHAVLTAVRGADPDHASFGKDESHTTSSIAALEQSS